MVAGLSSWRERDRFIECIVQSAGEPLPSDGQCLSELPSKQMKFHTTQIFEFKRGGRWVEKRERRRGREKTQPGQRPAPLANATGKVASFPHAPASPSTPCSLSLWSRLLEAQRALSRAVYRAMGCSLSPHLLSHRVSIHSSSAFCLLTSHSFPALLPQSVLPLASPDPSPLFP